MSVKNMAALLGLILFIMKWFVGASERVVCCYVNSDVNNIESNHSDMRAINKNGSHPSLE